MASFALNFDPSGGVTVPYDVEGWDPNGNVQTNPTTAPPASPSTSSSPSVLDDLTKIGTSVLGTVLGYQLQKQQISAGQQPSIGYNPATNAPQGQSVASQIVASKSGTIAGSIATSSWFVYIAVAIVAVLIFGGRR